MRPLGAMLATWASVTDNSNSSCSSDDRTSAASSSDGSFFTEADFASAVAKAAELSGLTVVGSTVSDPKGIMEKGEHVRVFLWLLAGLPRVKEKSLKFKVRKSQGILEFVREIWNFGESQGNLR